jgi:hypothetical protein
VTRRELLALPVAAASAAAMPAARIAITFDQYALRAGDFVREQGGHMHFFAVGRVFEHPSCIGVVDPELRTISMICRKGASRRDARRW